MSDRFPSKSITLDNYVFKLHGMSSDDHYWSHITDDFEPEFQRLCRKLIRFDSICVDIGANIGLKTLYLSRHCPRGRVIAVEAGKDVAKCLATNVLANGAHNVSLDIAAVAGHDGTIGFTEGSAWGHQLQDGAQVESITLKTIVERNNLPRLDFIKIDIEGMEFSVIKSSVDLIKAHESLVYLEFNSLGLLTWGNTNPREFLEWITANFKHVYAINRTNLDSELLEPISSADQCWTFFHRNFLKDGFVTDLLISNAEHRFNPVASHLEKQIDTLFAALSQVKAERDAILSERDSILSKHDLLLSRSKAELHKVTAERDALLTSTSWRISAPIRWLKRKITVKS